MIKGTKNSQRQGRMERFCFNKRGIRERMILNLPILTRFTSALCNSHVGLTRHTQDIQRAMDFYSRLILKPIIKKNIITVFVLYVFKLYCMCICLVLNSKLTPNNEIDVLASGVAHVVNSCTVVEARVGRCDSPQNQHWPSNLCAEGKLTRVTRPRHCWNRETSGDLTV